MTNWTKDCTEALTVTPVSRKKTMASADDVLKQDRMGQASPISSAPEAKAGLKQVALVGAGYIASIHAEALKTVSGVKLAGIIDPRTDRAAGLARRNGGGPVASSLEEMLKSQHLDAVHILTPPNLHVDLTLDALSQGLSVLLEKPMASDIAGARHLVEAATAAPASDLYVNHNFLFHPAFAQLAEMVRSKRCGSLMGLTCIFAMPLRQLAAGQIQHWMFRRPANLLLEQAVHPLSQMLSLCGPVSSLRALAGEPHPVASPSPIPRVLSVSMEAQNCVAQIHIHFGSSYPVWQITALCSDGVIKADMVQNRLTCEEQTENLEPLDNVIQTRRLSRELRTRARADLMSYGLSLLGLGKRSDTFYRSMVGSVGAFYRNERPWVNTPAGAAAIIQVCEDIAAQAFPAAPAAPRAGVTSDFKADAVVLGGTGFIGHHIVRALTAAGMKVTTVSRSPVTRDTGDNVRSMHGDIRDGKKLAELIGGAPFVINASGPEITENWADCERNVHTAVGALTDACERMGVRRLVHLSSVAALYLGNKGEIVTGRTPVDPHAAQRANYSRSKGLEEIALLTKHEETGLPVCILRPAIVVGEGGTPYHTGVGLFANERHCLGWNNGKNPLPFVLAQDVASAVLLAARREGINGRCYNLSGDVRLSAQEYVDALARAMARALVFHGQSPDRMYLSELMKWVIKRTGGRKVPLPSKRDLLSRTLAAHLDCSDAKNDLDWAPVVDRDDFLAQAIGVHARGFMPAGQ